MMPARQFSVSISVLSPPISCVSPALPRPPALQRTTLRPIPPRPCPRALEYQITLERRERELSQPLIFGTIPSPPTSSLLGPRPQIYWILFLASKLMRLAYVYTSVPFNVR